MHKYSFKISLLCYIFTLYQLWHLCQYGGLRSHLPELAIGAVGFIVTLFLRLTSKKQNPIPNSENTMKKKISHMEVVIFTLITFFFGTCIVYSAIPYHGALSWKIDEWMHQKEVKLEHDNLFESGIEGILEDLDEALDIPEELYITNKFQVTFAEDGTIQSIDAFLYGKEESGEKQTYLIDYDADNSEYMTVQVNGNSNGAYEEDMRLAPMLEILSVANWESQVKEWADSVSEDEKEVQTYELLYFGRRSFSTGKALRYLPGDVDGDGVDEGSNIIYKLRDGGQVVGFEVSLHILPLEETTPVRYIMEPEYITQEELNKDNVLQQSEEAKETDSWIVDQSDGTMYFFLDKEIGWRLVVTDAAAGSRFYVLEKTIDGGSTWERIHEDPFSGQLGVTEGLLFMDENIGFAGLTGASQSYSALYLTKDGGKSFEKIELPMDTVTQLPESAQEYGYTIVDFDYLHMPEKKEDGWLIKVTTEAPENMGILFQSTDNGVTWGYDGVVED